MASLGLDNTWVQSQDKAIKAGRLLGEVLEKQVQGQRPVVLVRPSISSRCSMLMAATGRVLSRRPHNTPRALVPGLPCRDEQDSSTANRRFRLPDIAPFSAIDGGMDSLPTSRGEKTCECVV